MTDPLPPRSDGSAAPGPDGGATPPPGRRPRADSVRNRARLLAAARELVGSHGPGVGIDEIAAAAGVAVGTVYRHFPTKEDLVAAVMGEYASGVADDVEAAARRVADGSRAAGELTAFLARVLDATSAVHALKTASPQSSRHLGEGEQRAAAALDQLLGRAQQDGDLHPDVTVADVYLLITTAPADRPAPDRARWLRLVTRGLLTAPAS